MFQIVYVCVQIWESKGPPLLTLGSLPFEHKIRVESLGMSGEKNALITNFER